MTPEEIALLKKTPAEYRASVIDPEVPRAFAVNLGGCPNCGDKFLKHGTYSWILDEDKPFKIQCPECKQIFPDNDFERYYKTKDRSLLTGKIVDDGRGYCKPGEQKKYWCVAYYHHWTLYNFNNILPLAEAYTRTGNPEFARRLFARLDRYAEVYSRYNYNKQSRYAEEVDPNYNGRMVNAIWETFIARDFAHAYRIAADFLQKEDPELTGVTGKNSAEIKNNIENNLFRIMANDIMSGNGKNAGNFGMHQSALLEISAALKESEMVKWVTDYRIVSAWNSTPLDYALYCNFFPDGAPIESPGYNLHWTKNLTQIAKHLDHNGVDVNKRYKHYQRILEYAGNLSLCGKFRSSSGDTGSLHSTGGEIEKDPNDPLKGFRSCLLPGYGTASLQNERPDNPAAFWMTYGAYPGHKHFDGLHIELFAEDTPLMPEFGYPETASADDKVSPAWFHNTVTHNTVVVDCSKQKGAAGVLMHYDPGKFAQRIEADAPEVSDNLSEYRRTDIVCEPFPGKLIVLDIFRIKGGRQHDWFMHGVNPESIPSENLKFVKQDHGTLAGRNVELGDYYDDETLQRGVSNYDIYQGSGFQYLTDVQLADGKSSSSITLPVKSGHGFAPSAEDTALRIHAVNGDGEKWSLSRGPTPRNQENVPQYLAFFNRRTAGNAPLQSMFVSVLETMSSRVPTIQEIRTLECSNDNVDILITLTDRSTLRISDFDRIKDGLRTQALLNDSSGKKIAGYQYSGKNFTAGIKTVDLKEEKVVFDREIPQEFVNSVFRVGKYSYRIGKIEKDTVWLKDQSMIRGRFRMHNNLPMPAMPLAKAGMYIYKADGRSVLGKYPDDLPADHPADQDLWIGEAAPGNEAVFTYPSVREIPGATEG